MVARRHEPKELGRRLGSADLVKKGRAKRSQRKATAGGPARLAFSKKDRAHRRPARSEADELAAVRRRVRLVMGLWFVGAVVVLGRAVQLQLLDGEQYSDVADQQATTSKQIKAKRGVIEDRHGAELAITVNVDSVFAEPRRIDSAQAPKMARALAPVLGISEARLEEKLSSGRTFTYLRRRVPADVAQAVRALDFPGVGTHPEPKRFYSNVGLAAHVLGFTNLDGEGRAGVERVFDEALQGSSMRVPSLRDALGNRVFSEGYVPNAVLEGSDLRLTLDRHIQHAAERALADAVTEHEARAGVALVLEPQSGDVLALASYPTYNPNNLSGTKPDAFRNRAVGSAYDPGSTMKMVTVAAALEEGLIEPQSKIDCEDGQWRFGGRTIRDANHRYGELSITEILQKSSNICSAKIGIMLERRRLYAWLRKFGFGEQTGIELPIESRGLLRSPEKWRDITLANIAFGQGLTATPLQIVSAAATIANGGVRNSPRLVVQIADKRGEVERPERPAPVRVISEATAREVARMMTEVTKPGGTAPAAAVPGFEVAGKTGTAQKIDPVTRAYSHELFTASFVGFVPADRPQVAILVLVDEPKGSYYGGTVAAPAFRRIALAALAARNVFPDSPEAKEAFLASHRPEPLPEGRPADDQAVPAEVGKWLDSRENGDEPALGDEILESLSPRAQALLAGDAPSPASAEGPKGPGRMPNFAGLKLHEVLNRSAEVRCDPVVRGTGRVVEQVPRAGAPIEPGAQCTVTLAPRGSKGGRGSGA